MAIREGLQATLPAAGAVNRERLRWILKADRAELWRGDGARNTAEWLSALFHISNWKARRWIDAANALESLPLTAAALEAGALSLDKVCDLVRFITPADESRWIKWARKTTAGGIRRRADEEVKRTQQEAEDIQRSRYLHFNRGDGHMWIDGVVPLDQGERLFAAIDGLARTLPTHPDDKDIPGVFSDDEPVGIDERRADALVLLATGGSSATVDTTVVLHAPIEALAHDEGGCTTGSGAVLHPETVRRLSCDARLQVVLEGKDGNALGIGLQSQKTPDWLRRQVFYRDGNTCTFPGCEMKRFLHPHHVVHWSRKGPTNLDNLLTVCTTHHSLLHEGRWSVTLGPDARPTWFRPSGRIYDPGPALPDTVPAEQKDPPTFAEAVGFSRLFAVPHLRARPAARRTSHARRILEEKRLAGL